MATIISLLDFLSDETITYYLLIPLCNFIAIPIIYSLQYYPCIAIPIGYYSFQYYPLLLDSIICSCILFIATVIK